LLARIPWWGWFCIILFTLYAIYNPAEVSVFHMWADRWEGMLSVKVLVTAAVATLVGVIVGATWKSIGLAGSLVILGLLAVMLWVVVDLGFAEAILGSAAWITQPIAAIVLTIGLRWARAYRTVTGRVQTDESDIEDQTAAR
jgi:hypothetical protein